MQMNMKIFIYKYIWPPVKDKDTIDGMSIRIVENYFILTL